jgi:hypothetical protein
MRGEAHLTVVEIGEVRGCIHVGPHQGCDERDRRAGWRFLRRLRFGGESSPASLERISAYYFLDHAYSEALLEATELAAVAPSLVHRACFVCKTHVLGSLLHGPLEETFAPLAGPYSVVLARGSVSTHGTEL